MKTRNIIFFASLQIVLFAACKKTDNASVTNAEAEYVAKKNAIYKDKGFTYLFSIDKGKLDSLQPIFFGKNSNGDIKYIIGEYKNGNSFNVAKMFNGGSNNWSLPGLNLSKLIWADYYSMDQQGGLEYESYNASPTTVFYLERNGALQTQKWTTEIGDSLWVDPTSFNNSPVNFNGNALKYRHGEFKVDGPFVFKGNLFRYFGYSYLIYSVPHDPMVESLGADLHSIKRSNNGLDYQKSFYTETVAEILDAKDDSYLEGLNIRLIETGKEDPSFVFLPNRKSGTPKKVTFWPSIKAEELMIVSMPYFASDLKFFCKGTQIYANTKNQLFLAVNNSNAPLPVQLNIDRIRGVFGNSNAILIVVENEEMGLDVIELL